MGQQPITRCKFHAACIDNAKPSAMRRLILYAARKPAPNPLVTIKKCRIKKTRVL